MKKRHVLRITAFICIAILLPLLYAATGDVLDTFNEVTEYSDCGSGNNPLKLIADVDGNGIGETMVLFKNYSGDALVMAGVTNEYRFSAPNVANGCGSSTGNGEYHLVFVDTLAPGFVYSDPLTYTYVTIDSVSIKCVSSATDRDLISIEAYQAASSFLGSETITITTKKYGFVHASGIDSILVTATSAVSESILDWTDWPYLDSLILHNNYPTITLGANPSVCEGTTSANLSYSATSNSPDQYSIVFDAGAITEGFVNVIDAALSPSPIVITVPSSASPDTYNATLTVKRSAAGRVSEDYPITVTVTPNTNITTQPTAQNLCAGGNATFTLMGTGTGTVTYQWQKDNSGSWDNLADGGNISGALTAGLTISSVAAGDADNYRCIVGSDCSIDVTSTAVALTVNTGPTSSVLSGTATMCSDSSTVLTVVITGGTSPYTVELDDGTIVPNYTSGSDITVSPGSTTSYNITSVTDANTCLSSGLSGSAVVTVVDCPPEVVCIMDLSGSMQQDFYGIYGMPVEQRRISYADAALRAFAELTYSLFSGETYFGLASFKNPGSGCRGNNDYDIGNLLTSTEYSTNIAPIINALTTSGGTNLLAGLDTAKNMFQTIDLNDKKAIVLLSDGAHNCPSYITNLASDVAYNDLIGQLNDKNIKVYTIAFGQSGEIDLDLLSDIATKTDGGFYDVTTPGDSIKAVLDPGVTTSDVWDAGNALDIAYSHVLNSSLGLNYMVDPMGLIKKGTTKEFDIAVSGHESKICFFVSWVKPQNEHLKVKIKNSNGTEIPANHPNISYIHRNKYTIITVSGNYLYKPGVVGTNAWKLILDASDIENEQEKFQYLAFNQSNRLKFNAWFDKEWYFTGDKMKIFMDIRLDHKRLTQLDKTTINGSKPEEGLGNWLNKRKITTPRLEEERKFQLNEIRRIAEMDLNKLKLKKDKKKKLLTERIEAMEDVITPGMLKSRILIKDKIAKYPGRLKIDGIRFNDQGKNGDEKAGDGIFTASFDKLNKEGTYKFNVGASHAGKENIKLENQLSSYVRVKIIPKKFIREYIQLETEIKGKKVYNITLNLRDEFGNVPHPNSLRHINLQVNKGELIGHIQANPDGTFTQKVAVQENVNPRQVKLSMNVYEKDGKQRLEAPIPNWIYIVLGIIIFILLLRLLKGRKK